MCKKSKRCGGGGDRMSQLKNLDPASLITALLNDPTKRDLFKDPPGLGNPNSRNPFDLPNGGNNPFDNPNGGNLFDPPAGGGGGNRNDPPLVGNNPFDNPNGGNNPFDPPNRGNNPPNGGRFDPPNGGPPVLAGFDPTGGGVANNPNNRDVLTGGTNVANNNTDTYTGGMTVSGLTSTDRPHDPTTAGRILPPNLRLNIADASAFLSSRGGHAQDLGNTLRAQLG